MAMDAGEVERLIKARLPDAKVTIRDLVGDGDHLSAGVVSQAFRGKTRVKQTNGGAPPVDFELVYPCHHFRPAQTPLHSAIRQTGPMSAVGTKRTWWKAVARSATDRCCR
jgi:hypothetical protein